MKHRLFTPGPTPVPEDVLLELARPIFYHRSAKFRALLTQVTEGLQYVFRTRHPVLTLTASGTGGMEAALVNAVPAGGKVICLIAGRWGERWRNIGRAYGMDVVSVTSEPGHPVEPAALAAALAAHPDAAAVCSTLCETATGVKNDIAAYGALVKDTPALLLVDSISGLGCVPCETDAWHVDINVTGSQKALMLPPGLAFVSVNDKAWRRIDQQTVRAYYFDLKRYRDALPAGDTPYTPANTLVRALAVALASIRAEGLEQVWARCARLAAAARAGVTALGLELFATVPAEGMTVMKVPAGVDGKAVLQTLESQHGVKLADGQDTLKGKIFRLAHMGYIDHVDLIGALAALELTLIGQGYPARPGVALSAAQAVLAQGAGKPTGA